MKNRLELTGQTFSRLTVLEFAGIGKHGGTLWKCICQCGTIKTVKAGALTSGDTQSCGCLHKDKAKETCIERNSSHGLSGTRLHRIWKHMRQRCLNPSDEDYKDYGGRGITVCQEWEDFEAFYNWATNNGYDKSLTIDRTNNDLGYSPENCKWEDKTTQARNTRKTFYILVNDKKVSLRDYIDQYGSVVSVDAVKYRLKHGWSLIEAITIPPHKTRLVTLDRSESPVLNYASQSLLEQ